MDILSDLFIFVLGAAFKEATLKPALKIIYRKSFILLPELFDKLDPIMPESISKLSPEEISSLIKQKIDNLVGEKEIALSQREKEKLFQEFLSQYNPLIAASKVGAEG